MEEEYDIIYIKPQDFELFLLQIPHRQKETENQQLSEFLKLKEVLLKQKQKKFRFIYEILQNLSNYECKDNNLTFESKNIQIRQNTCAAQVNHHQKYVLLFPIYHVQQLRKLFDDNMNEKEQILKQSEELIKKRNINKHFDTQILQYRFQKEIFDSENYQNLEISDQNQNQKFKNQLQEIPQNLRNLQNIENINYMKDLFN